MLAQAIKGLAPIDAKSVARDSLLRWLCVLPLLTAFLMRWGVPAVAARLRERWGFALEPYYPLITSLLLVLGPMLVAVVIGFLLLDQRDDGTLAALRVTPLSLNGFLVYRLAAPLVVSVALTMVLVPITDLVDMHPMALFVCAVAAAPLGPLFALFLASFASNKVQGFALMKAAGVLNWPPAVAYFLPIGWQWALGIVPTYWPVKVFWLLEAAEVSWLAWLPYLLVGLGYQAFLGALLLRRFHRVVARGQ